MSEWWIGKKKWKLEEKQIAGTEYFYYFDKGKKFVDDKIIVDDSTLFMLLDGVIFNKLELLKKANQESWESTLIDLYKKNGLDFIKVLRGSFNGVIVDKVLKETIVFVDQLGERAVFYNIDSDGFFVSTNFNRLIEYFREKEVSYSIDKEAIKNLLYFGYMIDHKTCVKEIKRIFPGNYLYKTSSQMEEKSYFRFSNKDLLQKTDEELIELIDKTFRTAIKRELDKDKEYGYHSLIDISGGMDARTISFVAKAMGYGEITNLCYSQMNAYERKIAEKLVKQLGNNYIFKALDNAEFIYKVDDLVKENFGLCYFAGITGGRDFLKILDKTYFGIEHTGILGDVYEGSFNEQPILGKATVDEKYRVSRLLRIDIDQECVKEYENDELFKFYTRGILAGMSTHLIRQNYIETYSPFADIDFLNLMFAIPLEQRVTGKIYMKWLNKKYAEALENTYAGIMCKPNSGRIKIKLRAAWNIFLIKVLLPLQKKVNYHSEWNYKGTMNPFEYWYEKNKDIKKFVDEYYEKHLKYVDDLEIKEYLEKLQAKGNMQDKMVMLTVISIYKQYQY